MTAGRAAALAGLVAAVTGCDWSLHRMQNTPRCELNEATPLLAGGSCNLHPPAGTVPWRAPSFTAEIRPAPVDLALGGEIRPVTTRELIVRGRVQFDRFCSVCHGVLGDGTSEVAENMTLRPPPSLHLPRIVNASDPYLFRIATEGYGLMPGYQSEMSVVDRWAVVAYVRVLQRSQDVALDELPPTLREEALRWLP